MNGVTKGDILIGTMEDLENYFDIEMKIKKWDEENFKNGNIEWNENNTIRKQLNKIKSHHFPCGAIQYMTYDNSDPNELKRTIYTIFVYISGDIK